MKRNNNKVCRESVCIFDSCFGLNLHSLMPCFVNRGRHSATPPLPITYYVWPMLTKSRIVNTFRLGNLSLLIASRSSVRSPYSSSSSSRFSFFFFCFFVAFCIPSRFRFVFLASSQPEQHQEQSNRTNQKMGNNFLISFREKKNNY